MSAAKENNSTPLEFPGGSESWEAWPSRSLRALQATNVNVWRVVLEIDESLHGDLRGFLTAAERDRERSLPSLDMRRRFVARRAFLRCLLGELTESSPEEIVLSTDEGGKLQLTGHELDFSLSHSHELAIVAVHTQGRVGVDVERIDPTVDWAAVARASFSESERALVEASPSRNRAATCLRIWTRKEALAKCLGVGITTGFQELDVSSPEPHSGESRFRLIDFVPDLGYQASLAAEGGGGRACLWDYRLPGHGRGSTARVVP